MTPTSFPIRFQYGGPVRDLILSQIGKVANSAPGPARSSRRLAQKKDAHESGYANDSVLARSVVQAGPLSWRNGNSRTGLES